MIMELWRVLARRQERDDLGRDGTRLLLDVERDGHKRTVQVSGFTWDRAEVGKEVELPR